VTAPDPEEFAAWRADPTTQWVMAAFVAKADEQERAWHDASWNNGAASQAWLQELRTRSDTFLAMAEATYDDLLEANRA
jgi:hypothetical protein